MIKFNGYVLKKVADAEARGKHAFDGAITSTDITDLPISFGLVEAGYYVIEGLNQYIKLSDSEYSGRRSIYFPLWKKNVIHDWLKAKWERDYQEELAEVLAEITVFNNDMETELDWNYGVATMKPYYNKSIRIEVSADYEQTAEYRVWNLILNDLVDIEIHWNADYGYSCFDGVEGYGWSNTIKKAVKRYMDDAFRYSIDGDDYEASCSSCGDGGCVHCEPHRFM